MSETRTLEGTSADRLDTTGDDAAVSSSGPPSVFAGRSLAGQSGDASSARPIDPGRLGVYALLGAATGSVPLPWLPDVLTRRIRGGLVQDIARRQGVAVPRDARDVLCEPSGTEGPRGMMGSVRSFVTGKVLARLGPIAVLPPVKSALETFVLGHLLHRYLEIGRRDRGRRLDVVEARRVRRAIDRALLAALTVDVPLPRDGDATLPGDERDAVTAIVDRILSKTASLPSWLVQRVDVAFDECFPQVEG